MLFTTAYFIKLILFDEHVYLSDCLSDRMFTCLTAWNKTL